MTPDDIPELSMGLTVVQLANELLIAEERLAAAEAKWDSAVKQNEMLVAEVASMESERNYALERLAAAEADADRLAQALFLMFATDDTSEHALRLHDEAVARRSQP